jgi:hypothetical protein
MIYSKKLAFIFFELGKTGSTSIQSVLARYGQVYNARKPEHYDRFVPVVERGIIRAGKRYRVSVREINKHIAPWMVEQCLARKEVDRCFKFAFVRNPFDKAVSLYKFHTRNGVEKADSFAEYLQAFQDRYMDSEPQIQWLSDTDGTLLVDFIGRYENLQTDFDRICERLGIRSRTLPHKLKSRRKHYTEYYDRSAVEFVARMYQPDLDYFGYNYGD